MKNKIVLVLLSFFLLESCKLTESNSDNQEPVESTEPDTAIVKDKDENGCHASAGYTWSQVNKECVKLYSGIELTPFENPTNEDETLSAFLMFSENQNQAEVFLPNETKSIVLTRVDEGKPWIFEDWQLVAWKGYILKKGEQNLFSGDGEIGVKVLGSDTQE